MNEKSFLRTVAGIAVPVALQSMLQSSFSMIDQVMVGQLGSTSIAAIGIAGRFAFMYSTIIGAVAAICGIMVSQYMGQHDDEQRDISLCVNLAVGLALAVIFFVPSFLFPGAVISLYSKDAALVDEAIGYLKIISGTYPATGIAAILAVRLRCGDRAAQPLFASIVSAVTNTALNWCLIFGKMGAPALGVRGAGMASLISGWINAGLVILFFIMMIKRGNSRFYLSLRMDTKKRIDYVRMLLPLVVTEFLWSLGQNVYAGIYGHIGIGEMAAIQVTSPIESLSIGALSGVAQAAGILIGKRLGSGEDDKAYIESEKLIWYGIAGSLILSALVIALRTPYVGIYKVEDGVKLTACALLVCFALLSPFKVFNMILGGGVLRSGGKTNYIMWIDIFGTWVLGVPVGLVMTRIFAFPVATVYFCIGLEEIVRAAISLKLFLGRKWMVKI